MQHFGQPANDSHATADEPLAIGLRPGHGLGVFARRAFPAGAVLDCFSGIIGNGVEQHSLQVGPGAHIIGTRFIGFLSHGCAPNCRLDMARFRLVALRALAAGEWLTIDYAQTEDRLHAQFACACGAASCRGWITGRAETVSAAGRAHLAALGRPAAWWERPDLGYRGGRLQFAGQDVAALADAADGPLYLYSPARALANLGRLHAALAQTGCAARVLYAMKANRFRPLLEAFARSGRCGVDVCSPGELELALDCGFAAGDASFTGTGVANRDLDRLLAHPGLTINCDSIGMIRRIGERAPGRAIGIRVNPGLGVGHGDSERLTYAGARTTKFGIYREQWDEALATARAHGLAVTALHFHVGCGYLDAQLERWERALAGALAFLDDVPQVRSVNIGGGLGVPHRPGEAPLDLDRWAAILRRHFAGRGVSLVVEPGDFLVKDAGLLVLRVTDSEVKRDTRFVSVDGGFNLHPEPAFYDLPCHPVACVPRAAGPAGWQPVTIAGNINEALDLWAEGIAMPPLAEGDALALLNAGGYGAAMSSNHCLRGAFTEMAV